MIEAPRRSPLTGMGLQLGGSPGARVNGDQGGQEFSTVLAGFASQSIATMRQGEQAAIGGIAGSVPIQDVVDKLLAAEQAMQSTLAVRDKVVSAWLEISRITI